MTPDASSTPSIADDIVQMVVRVLLAIAILLAMLVITLFVPTSYGSGLVTGTLAPVLLMAMKKIYDAA